MGRFSEAKIDWRPFSICAPHEKPPYPRALSTPEGLGDRLRFVGFAELQASHAFTLASEFYPEVSPTVKKIWGILADEENKHLHWLKVRMHELGVKIDERPQSLALWNSFDRCTSPEKFAEFMANAEERGRIAGDQFYETLLKIDSRSAEIFYEIAKEEREHIRLAQAITEHQFQIPDDFSFELNTLPRNHFGEIPSKE